MKQPKITGKDTLVHRIGRGVKKAPLLTTVVAAMIVVLAWILWTSRGPEGPASETVVRSGEAEGARPVHLVGAAPGALGKQGVRNARAPRFVAQLGHHGWVNSVALSADGRRVLTGSWDKTARLWDAATGQEIQRFAGHAGRVSSVALSADGRRVLTGSWDKTARLWDAAGPQHIKNLLSDQTLTGDSTMGRGRPQRAFKVPSMRATVRPETTTPVCSASTRARSSCVQVGRRVGQGRIEPPRPRFCASPRERVVRRVTLPGTAGTRSPRDPGGRRAGPRSPRLAS